MNVLLRVAALGLVTVACFELREPRVLPREAQDAILALRSEFEESRDPTKLISAARIYRREGFLFEASEALHDAEVAADQELPELRAEKARTFLALGLPAAVVRELKNCLRQDPRQPDCLLGFAKLLEGDGTPGALREARRVYALFLEHAPPAHPERADAQSALEKLGGPIGTEDGAPLRLADRLPPEAMANNPHGSAATESGEGAPLNPFGLALQEALTAVRNQDFAAAEAAFLRALELRPDHPSTLASLAEARWGLGKREEAFQAMDRAMELGPEDPQVRFMFGALMLRAGERLEEAQAAWTSLLRDDPELAEQLGLRERLSALQRVTGEAARPGTSAVTPEVSPGPLPTQTAPPVSAIPGARTATSGGGTPVARTASPPGAASATTAKSDDAGGEAP